MPDLAILFPILIVVLYLFSSIKILAEYERGVVFRLGRVLSQPKGPGVILVFKPIDRLVRISLRIEAMEVPAQDIITRDNVTVKVNAVVYFRVVDPSKAVLEVTNFLYATSQVSQTTLRSGSAHRTVGRESDHRGSEAGGSGGSNDSRYCATGGGRA
jgi:regulator of protease activity HflC (stomatin/prohibitin superfamily)